VGPWAGEKEVVRSEQDVDRLVRDHEELVQYAVNRYLKRYFVGAMEREDIVSWGMMGLLCAARAWDPARASSFTTLACMAIDRMIIRGVKREWKPEQAAVTVPLDALLMGEETEGRDDRFIDQLSSDQNLEQEMLDSETRAAVRSAVAALPAPQRRLIERHFFEGIPMTQIAHELGLSRQGAYLRQRLILDRLRAVLDAAPTGHRPASGSAWAGSVSS
jgi:RNA polymerase sigma factor (sigma-70 family)